jgi:hypothetical protein
MKLYRKSALVAAALALGLSAAHADAPSCNLGLMASLDMTMLQDGRFTVPVSLNGTSAKFLVDTGGVYTEIDSGTATALGLKQVPVAGEMYGVAGKIQITAANVESFKLGNVELKNIHVAISQVSGGDQKPKPETADRVAGLLAPKDVLSLFDVELDFAAKKMNLFSQDHCPGKVVYWTRGGYAELPFRFTTGAIASNPHIVLDMVLDGHSISTMLDTGSPGSWLMKKPASQIYGVDEHTAGVIASPYARDGFPAFRKPFGAIALGGLAVQNPQVDIMPSLMEDAFRMAHSEKSRDDPIYGSNFSPEDFILGMNVVSKLHAFVSYKERKLYITAADAH